MPSTVEMLAMSIPGKTSFLNPESIGRGPQGPVLLAAVIRHPRWTGQAWRGALLSIFFLMVVSGSPAAQLREVDLELVLAVDASGSVDDQEFALQMGGIAAAFRHADVHAAIAEGAHRTIAVTIEVWAEASLPKDVSDWHLIDSPESARAFAALAESFPRRAFGGTGIGRAVVIAVDLITRNRYDAVRRVIDISGDGRETTSRDWSITPELARFKADRFGVTINGLAILSDDPELADYYRRNVVSGSEAFVMSVANFNDFAEAMRMKLIREIRYRPKLSGTPQAGHGTGP